MNILFALLFGALAGFLATTFMNERSGLVKNIILGVIGGSVGSIVFKMLGISTNGRIGSLVTAVVGACICIWIGKKLF